MIKKSAITVFSLGLVFLPLTCALTQTPPAAKAFLAPEISTAAVRRIESGPTLSLAEAVDLALRQASDFTASQINEKIAAEDIRQARAAFLPKIDLKPNYIYTSPSLGGTRPRTPSFLGANAVNEIQGLVVASGEIDLSGRLSATLRRNRELLASAHARTEVAQKDLVQAVSDAYFALALSTAKRRAAESNLAASQEFENNTKLQLDAGEVAPVDYTRARLQTAARRDELAQSITDESINGDGLRVFTGTAFGDPIATTDLLTELPVDGDVERFSEATIASRVEFAQFEADRKAAQADISIARADRKPQVTYTAGGGFVTDSLAPVRLRDSTGVQFNIGMTIPIFDWGAAKSRETQARLKVQLADNSRAIAELKFVQAFFTARTQALSARERVNRLAASIVDAQANLSASIARYRSGEATILEVTEAQNTFVMQKTALYQAIFDYQTARSRLMRAAGQ